MHTDLLETPDIYWEHPRLEELYHMVSREMDIVSRVACTNRCFFRAMRAAHHAPAVAVF